MNFTKALAIAASILLSTGSQLAMAAEEGAKGLYLEQMKKPSSHLNTGVRYWIELIRKGQPLKVNNKVSFLSGDKIRFHVQPNIDGYAYILLRSGSRGEQSVLFPDPSKAEDNRVVRGKEIALPYDGFLTFDNNPGIEKVTLLLSRTPLDAKAYLAAPEESRTLVASAATGSKDLIPSKIVLAYTPPQAPIALISDTPPKPVKEAPAAKKVNQKSKASLKAKRAATVKKSPAASADEAIVTVVYKDPTGVLALDVALQHN